MESRAGALDQWERACLLCAGPCVHPQHCKGEGERGERGSKSFVKLEVKSHLARPGSSMQPLSPGPAHLAQALPPGLLQRHDGPSQGIAQGDHRPDEVLLLFGQGRQQVRC